MNLTRYQFELLSYFESCRSTSYSQREVADKLCISGNQIKDSFEYLQNNDLITVSDSTVVVTDDGLAALEPYKVKRAVILAAGFGSRMMPATADRPKPMVTVNGKYIIETLLDALAAAEITDITLVRGYKKERFDDLKGKYPFVQFIDNDDYDKTNNISSAILALDSFKDGCYLCEADLYITNPAVITKYQYCSNILGSYSLETDDWSFRLKNGFITDYQKGNSYCYNYYGISYWTPEDCKKLAKDWIEVFETEEGKDVFWEIVPLQLRKENYNVEIRQCNKQDIMEIDNYYELALVDESYRNE